MTPTIRRVIREHANHYSYKDIAAFVGVSISTVHRTLHPSKPIRPDVFKRMEKKMVFNAGKPLDGIPCFIDD